MKNRTEIEAVHQAAQYLTTMAKCYIPKKDDDSHTKLDWDVVTNSLMTQKLNDEGLRLKLNLQEFSLDITHPVGGLEASFPLAGAKHFDVVTWLERERQFCNLDAPYVFELHFELPYDKALNDHFEHPRLLPGSFQETTTRFDSANKVFNQLLEQHTNMEWVGIWPHHFDMASLIHVNESDTIGIGLAPPDNISDQPYFYVSGYEKSSTIDPASFDPLPQGEWKSGDWKGGLLLSDSSNQREQLTFLQSAVDCYQRFFETN